MAAAAIEIVLDDTSTASCRYLQRRQDLHMSPVNYNDDNRPVDLISISSRHIADQLTYIDAVRSCSFYCY